MGTSLGNCSLLRGAGNAKDASISTAEEYAEVL
jgi:hypothetical protein